MTGDSFLAMVIHYKPKSTLQQPFTPFAHIVWLIHLPGKVIDLLLSDPFPPERCQRALISQTPCLCFSVTWPGSCLPFSGLEGAAPQLSHCLAGGDGFRAIWHNLCLSGKASASSFMFWTELHTPCDLGDSPESPEGKLRENSFLQPPPEAVVRGNSLIPPSGLMFPSPQPLHLSNLMQTKFCFQYLYGPCCCEMGSLFWWKFLVLLENSASWNIHPLCVQQAAFSISSVKILLATASAAGTHTLMQMKNDADWDLAGWSCRLEDKEQNWMLQNMRFISSRCQPGHHISALWRYRAIIDVLCAGRAVPAALIPLSGNCFSWCRLMDFQ